MPAPDSEVLVDAEFRFRDTPVHKQSDPKQHCPEARKLARHSIQSEGVDERVG